MTIADVKTKSRHKSNPTGASDRPPRITIGGTIIDIVLTLSVIVLLFVTYTFFWSGVRTERIQGDARAQLVEQWSQPTPPTGPNGDAKNPNPESDAAAEYVPEDTTVGTPATTSNGMAIMTAPRLGADWAFVVFPGVDQGTLAMGPGWYTETQQFGEVGNAAIAGHRDGAGAPFHDADAFTTCDEIIIETQDAIHTYRVLPTGNAPIADMAACASEDIVNALAAEPYANLTGSYIVDPAQGEVVFPVPMNGEAQATLPLLTITTCHPIWSNAQRLITHAVLTNTSTK